MLKEFREFALRGNVMDMSIGIVLGAAFGAIVQSFVKDLLMPLLGLLTSGVDLSNSFAVLREGSPAGPYATLAAAQAAGAITLNYGLFANLIVSFVLVAFAIFLVVRVINRLRRERDAAPAQPTTKTCAYCCSVIPLQATRCPACTSVLSEAA